MDSTNNSIPQTPISQEQNTSPSATYTATPQPVYPQQPVYMQPEKPKSKWKKALIRIGILVLLLGLLFGYLILQGVKDAPKVQQKVTNFLQLVSNNDLETAYTLTSTQFKESTPKEDFIKAMSLFKAQYSGFKEQKQTGFSVEVNAGQPTLYKYSGTITYLDGDQGELAAVLLKEDGEWKILSIRVNVDIKRLEKFQQTDDKSVLGESTEK